VQHAAPALPSLVRSNSTRLTRKFDSAAPTKSSVIAPDVLLRFRIVPGATSLHSGSPFRFAIPVRQIDPPDRSARSVGRIAKDEDIGLPVEDLFRNR
jgi:hypothetical protein